MAIARPHLLLIDPQVDFCNPAGSLFVAGSPDDCDRTATFVKRVGDRLADIHVTLDSHHHFDIAHPIFWKDRNGNHPVPFTIIPDEDVVNGIWNVSVPSTFKKALAYTRALKAGGRYPLCIWPPHCRIGTPGACVETSVLQSLTDWEDVAGNVVDKVTKGSNMFTEHYSAIKAEVPDPEDPSTGLNVPLVTTLQNDCDDLFIAGQALSHCVANTVIDLADAFGNDDYVKKIVLLTDLTSPVPGFESAAQAFITKMTARGMRLAKSTEVLK